MICRLPSQLILYFTMHDSSRVYVMLVIALLRHLVVDIAFKGSIVKSGLQQISLIQYTLVLGESL
jgi:hypothetical protein